MFLLFDSPLLFEDTARMIANLLRDWYHMDYCKNYQVENKEPPKDWSLLFLSDSCLLGTTNSFYLRKLNHQQCSLHCRYSNQEQLKWLCEKLTTASCTVLN